MLLTWIIIFIVSLVILVKGADWLLDSAEKIGLALGLPSFVVGVLIVGVGTSCPELVSAIVAALKGVTEIIPANAVGANIINILLVTGVAAIIARRLSVSKSLIDLDLPLLIAMTFLFIGIAWDGRVVFGEAFLMVLCYGIYLLYSVLYKDDGGGDIEGEEKKERLPSRRERRALKGGKRQWREIRGRDLIILVLGILGLAFGAKYLIESVVKLSEILEVGVGLISLGIVALGTTLPELMVSAKAAFNRKAEVALGNVFGSNVFNLLIVVGLPGLFKTLSVDEKTLLIGLPVLCAATLLFVISGISRRIHIWEGAVYIVLYVFFVGKLFGLL